MATLFDENSNMTALAASALNGVTAGPSTAGTTTNLVNSNTLVNQLLSTKDSRWLQIEVCREYQRGQCSRSEQECKYAHPPAHVDVQNGRVTACYDSIKGRCTRENPKCKYLHPPQHLKDQLLQAGRNNLALKNLICSQLTQSTAAMPTILPGQIAHLVQQPTAQPSLVPTLPFIPPYLTALPAGYPTLISTAPTAGAADPYQTANGNGPIPLKRSALDKNGVAVAGAQNQGLHVYAQHTAQFNPYLVQSALPGYIPVSFAGQLPPRF